MTVEHIMKLVEDYRTAGGREEHWARRDILLAAVEELVKDAERYRFLRDADKCDMHTDQIWQYAMESLDGAVDAGIAAMKDQS